MINTLHNIMIILLLHFTSCISDPISLQACCSGCSDSIETPDTKKGIKNVYYNILSQYPFLDV